MKAGVIMPPFLGYPIIGVGFNPYGYGYGYGFHHHHFPYYGGYGYHHHWGHW